MFLKYENSIVQPFMGVDSMVLSGARMPEDYCCFTIGFGLNCEFSAPSAIVIGACI